MNDKIPKSAGGWGALFYSLKMARRAGGLGAMLKALYSKNACKTCALGMGGQRGGMKNESGRFPEVCNKSFQAQASDMNGALPEDFFETHSINELSEWSPRQLELSGRITRPVLHESRASHYRAVSWQEAYQRVADALKATLPERSYFYASGRSSNEAGFLLQLFARAYGTNNLNNCSFYCHQASGVGLSQSLGTGTATIRLEDLGHADLLFLIGANPASNHPRFMRILMEIRRRRGKVVVINPARERGLENFSVPSDPWSLFFGSEISSRYVQPDVGGDLELMRGIAKALLEMAESDSGVLDSAFIASATEGFDEFRRETLQASWDDLESGSGVSREEMKELARIYAKSENAIFAWAMGITHHARGVENVQMIVNLALMRGMAGRKHAGLLPLRGHSNVQGIGSMGFSPKLKETIQAALENRYGISLPTDKGLDTMACMESAERGEIDFAWHLGGNLYSSNPDSRFAEKAFSKIGFALYMNTTLNQGHFRGRGKTTLILPVRARDEEPQPTSQESMFNFVRLSDGGPERYKGPESEATVISEIARRVLPEGAVPWSELENTSSVRKIIADVAPGFDKMRKIDETREEFYIKGRALYDPVFPTENGKARFLIPSQEASVPRRSGNQFLLTTVRSEGQFNTVVFDLNDRYRGVQSRNVVFMNPDDLRNLGLNEYESIAIRNGTGEMTGQLAVPYPIKSGNIMMYYPEANILVPKIIDERSRTPAFKSVLVEIAKQK